MRHRERRRLEEQGVRVAAAVEKPGSRHVFTIRDKELYVSPGAGMRAVANTASDGLQRGSRRRAVTGDRKKRGWVGSSRPQLRLPGHNFVWPRNPSFEPTWPEEEDPSGPTEEVQSQEEGNKEGSQAVLEPDHLAGDEKRLPLAVAKQVLQQLSVVGRQCFPQSNHTWYVRTRRLRVWLPAPEAEDQSTRNSEASYRPMSALVFDSAGNMLAAEPLPRTGGTACRLSAEGVALLLIGCFERSNHRDGRAMAISFDEEIMESTLGPALNKIGIETSGAKPPPQGVEGRVLRAFCLDLRQKTGTDRAVYDGPSMCTACITRPPRVNSFFVAAADFFRTRPWRLCGSEGVFVLHFPANQVTASTPDPDVNLK